MKWNRVLVDHHEKSLLEALEAPSSSLHRGFLILCC